MKIKWIDISVRLDESLPIWPGDMPLSITRISNMDKGNRVNLSAVSMGTHTGTHVDAPLHFFKDGRSLDKIPLDTLIGPCRVIKIKDRESIKKKELVKYKIKKGERILFKTTNSRKCWKTNRIHKNYVYISTEASRYLVSRNVKTIGIDYLSVGGYGKNGLIVHGILLKEGILLIEGLDLSKVNSGRYEMLCLPIKLIGVESAPARVILRKI